MNLDKFQYGSSMGLTLVMEKHGTHDQKTHGNWATGATMGEGVASSILERVKANGGLSVNMVDGSEPTSGYMVAKGSQYGSIASADDFYDPVKGPKILAEYMKKNKSDLATGKNYLGLWHNTADGQVYLDISENIQDVDTARTLGAKRDQISIWDVANFAEIETGGTGNVGKTRGSQTARHLEDDGRGNRPVRPATLGQVGKALKVIRFEAGLIPVFKHLQGQHDQSTHGAWATGGYTEEQQLGMAEMEGKGPSIEDLDNLSDALLSSGNGPSLDDMISIVENDQGLYEQAIEGIDERVDAEMADFGWDDKTKHDADFIERQRNQVYEEQQTKMIDEFISNESDLIHTLYEEQTFGGSALSRFEEMTGLMDEVYSYEMGAKDSNGNDVTLYSQVTNMEPSSYIEGGIKIYGVVQTTSGDSAGEFERTMYKQNGTWMVEHDIYQMYDDYKGTGFGTKFIQQQEDWYTTRGFGAIIVGTAWDGARHWARAGFDWHPSYVEDNISRIANESQYSVFRNNVEDMNEFHSLMSRAYEGYDPNKTWSNQRINGTVKLKPITNDDFPLPNDFATIGIARKTRDSDGVSSWGGKLLMDNLNLKYTKVLTAEGRSVLQGAIDRDGDGLIYDGTAREKPVPAVNLTP